MKPEDMVINETYCFSDKVPLTYLGYKFSGNGYWHQFGKKNCVEGDSVWCELLSSDLHLINKVEND